VDYISDCDGFDGVLADQDSQTDGVLVVSMANKISAWLAVALLEVCGICTDLRCMDYRVSEGIHTHLGGKELDAYTLGEVYGS
jgi:hypothetical protein